MSTTTELRIAIIGAGPSGIAAGRELLRRGFTAFTIFDELDAPGGTWRQHSYPGLACDVWAHSYSFSYAPNPDWSASFVGQPEIQAYLARCASAFGLDPHLRLNTCIRSARYQDDGTWKLATAAGEEFAFDVVINAMGNQHTPLFPDVQGMDLFRGKRVAVVGSAAAAVQIVPEIARIAGHLTVLQRSANWIMPRGRKPYSERQRRLARRFPFLIKLTRVWQRLLMGQVQYAVTRGHKRMEQFESIVRKFIARSVSDPRVREALVPDSRYGCKRGLVSDDFYPALNRPNVELVPSALREVTPTGLIVANGRQIDVDVIVYCTGYRILDFDRIEVRGAEGATLAEVMADDPRAHKGITVPGFPNYFFAVGPNGLVLNVSYFVTAEKNIATIVRLLDEMRRAGATRMAVKRDVFERYNAWLSGRFGRYSWGSADCHSYYRNAAGHAPFLFPGSFREFRTLQDEAGLHEYELG
jgi:cation diffusion facilitator CzcD-associated flavoprotein CzcO